MSKNKKRWLSAILSVTMLFSLCSGSVFAEGAEETTAQEIVETVQEQKEISEIENDDVIKEEIIDEEIEDDFKETQEQIINEKQYEDLSLFSEMTSPVMLMSEEGTLTTETGLQYEIFMNEVKITGCDASVSGPLEIPNEIDGYPVTEIGASAFSGHSNLTSIIVPNSVISIGLGAFNGCTNLTEITIPFVGQNASGATNCHFGYIFGASSYDYNGKYVPTNLKKVTITGGAILGDYAFYCCFYLTTVILPNTLTKIGDYSFYMYNSSGSLKNIVIPNGVTSIGEYAFSVSTSSANNALTTITLPNTLLSIGEWAFGRSDLKSVQIPNSVTSIGDYAFFGCTALASVSLSNKLSRIGNYTFKGCTTLMSINFPESVKAIGDHAFENCKALTKLNIPGNVSTVNANAFLGCNGITNLSIGDGTATLGDYAFKSCTGLIKAVVPDSVKTVGTGVFSGDSALTLYGYNGSEIEKYANTNKIPFVVMSGPTAVSGITLNKSNMELYKGNSGTIVATVLPENATNKSVNWSSSDETVAVVSNGVVTAVTEGIATITATTVDGEYSEECTVTVKAPDASATVVSVSNVGTKAGKQIEVALNLKNCSGFSNLALEVGYNKNIMELKGVTNLVPGASFTEGRAITLNPYNMQWDSASDITYNGDIAVLTFAVKEDAPDDVYPITVDYYKGRNGDNVDGESVNYKENPTDPTKFVPINLSYVSGDVTVLSYSPGDINGDGSVNNKDATYILRYFADWSLADLVEDALDTNGDGIISNKDATHLLRYFAGWNVILH